MTVPPVAHRTLCVDFDATIFPWGPLDDDSPPIAGAVEAVKEFVRHGYNIVIFTSRMSPTWWRAEVPRADGMSMREWVHQVEAFGFEQRQLVEERLRNFDIPYRRITSEKVPAEHYIDDRAMEFHGDWKDITSRVLGVTVSRGNPR